MPLKSDQTELFTDEITKVSQGKLKFSANFNCKVILYSELFICNYLLKKAQK